jgi:hypothetical protein
MTTRPTDAEIDAIAKRLAPFNTRMILTGAGFSRPWGGYLAAELWSLIISEPSIRSRVELDRVLHDELNFEEVLARIEVSETSDFNDDDRRVMRAAVTNAFELQEQQIKQKGSFLIGSNPDLERMLINFTARPTRGTTCFFTLNQDLLMERLPKFQGDFGFVIPGVTWGSDPQFTKVDDFSPTPFEALAGKRAYLKLHGSMSWHAAHGDVAVLGGAKKAAIDQFDILRMNNAIFRQALMQQDARLLVIGYGFADDHINETIGLGLDRGLKLWIVDPREPASIRERLSHRGRIWHSVVGHYRGPATDLFAPGTIEEHFFRDRFWPF